LFQSFRENLDNPVQDTSVSRFRKKRGRLLRRQIADLAEHFGQDITILDVGGRPDYWLNIGFDRIARIDLLNRHKKEIERELPAEAPREIFTHRIGDARNLSAYEDGSVHLVHSNSVIEHVGGWRNMRAMAKELMRVGRSGWVQTPAWEFPIEPHFQVPFMHWFGGPLSSRLMSISAQPRLRRLDVHKRRQQVERINLLSGREVRALFPGTQVYVERLLIAKSYIVRWSPEAMALSTRPTA
jgi:hypothetical protein